jgi:hypothetical protein
MHHRRWFVVLLLIAGFQLVCIRMSPAAEESGCVKCHANEAIIKALHKPKPLPPAGSGEG